MKFAITILTFLMSYWGSGISLVSILEDGIQYSQMPNIKYGFEDWYINQNFNN